MIRNREFYVIFSKMFRRSLEALRRQEELTVHHELEEWPEFLSDGSIHITTAIRQRFHLSQEDGEKLQELPEFGELVSFVVGSELAQDLLVDFDNKPLDASRHSTWLFQYLYLPLFSRYTHEVGGLEFRESIFGKLYQGIEEYCVCSTVDIVCVAPIFGVALASDVELPIRLDSGLIIRELEAQERNRLWEGAADSLFYDKFAMYGLRFAAEHSQQVEKHHPSYLISGEIFILLEDFLRLIKRHPIAIRFLKAKTKPWYNSRVLVGGTLSWPRTGVVGRMLIGPAVFNSDDAHLLQQFWQAWPTINVKDGLALALRYFGSSCDKAELADRLIDLWIGLEALFSDQTQELGYRLGLRISRYLGKDAPKRDEIFKNIKGSYDCRSYLVHGRGGRKGRKRYESDLQLMVQRTEGYLADSLRTCIASRALPDLDGLDKKIVRGN